MPNEYRKERSSVTDLKIHLICVTKYREPVLTIEGLGVIEKAFSEVSKKMRFEMLEFNGEEDHVHCRLAYPPKLSISQMVNALKGVSSRRYGQAELLKPKGKKALWSPSYFALSIGGAPVEGLKEYIKNQKKPS